MTRLVRDIRDQVLEECAQIADRIMNDADSRAAQFGWYQSGDRYGIECSSEAAQEIAKAIRALKTANNTQEK